MKRINHSLSTFPLTISQVSLDCLSFCRLLGTEAEGLLQRATGCQQITQIQKNLQIENT